MASGLYVLQDGLVMVAYGTRRIAISYSQYKANGYKPALEKLMTKSPLGSISARCALCRAPPRRAERPVDDRIFDNPVVSGRGEQFVAQKRPNGRRAKSARDTGHSTFPFS
jgi:hypothetical protein